VDAQRGCWTSSRALGATVLSRWLAEQPTYWRKHVVTASLAPFRLNRSSTGGPNSDKAEPNRGRRRRLRWQQFRFGHQVDEGLSYLPRTLGERSRGSPPGVLAMHHDRVTPREFRKSDRAQLGRA
jgi:hypothetical protein